ncbi:MAG: ribulose-phosphate 3-epimerase [Ruminococcus sp.]|jgi:ribulose-phosphate 3-epimerase|nr:ribulose-phosphate 3-epimerase [Ruminococcus sp.]
MENITISASILCGNLADLKGECKRLEDAHIPWLHFDVMDGVFVPNITFGIPVLSSLKFTSLFKDVHLMIDNPVRYVKQFADAGADVITFHYEAIGNSVNNTVSDNKKIDIENIIGEIKKHKKKVGISVKPNTDISVIDEFLPLVDLVLIMSVEPGFGGQKFMPEVLSKLRYLKEKNFGGIIQIDGGIDNITAPKAIKAGANCLVSGSYLFNSSDIDAAARLLCPR